LPFLLLHLASRAAFKQAALIVILLPLIYFLMNVPYTLAGRPFSEVFMIYGDQAGTYSMLSMNAPNPWYVLERLSPGIGFSKRYFDTLILAGVAAAGVLGLGIVALGLRKGLRLTLTENLLLMTMIAVAFPSVIPKMHDRYFFLADTFALLLAMMNFRFIAPAVLIQTGSLFAYVPFCRWCAQICRFHCTTLQRLERFAWRSLLSF
jgi:Gpi18-like mannosyltransferase